MRFLDTNAILISNLDEEEYFAISSVSLEELEAIKVNKNKTEELRYKARKAVHWLNDNVEKYKVIIYTTAMEEIILNHNLEITPDTKIIATAVFSEGFVENTPDDRYIFVTNDLCCRLIAKNIFGLMVSEVCQEDDTEYRGYKEVVMSEEDMAYFYEHQTENIYELLTNEYLIMKDKDFNEVDCVRWDGESHQSINKKNVETMYFSKLKPKDIYQKCAIDSLLNTTITAVSGKAGSGKSLLSLMVAMYLIEKGKYDRIVILFNPTKTRGASDMGFYGGTADEKARQNSIGNILTTKFGDDYAVDVLIANGKIKLVSMADCRGMEIRDNEILWITECQNTSIDLIKLCLSRVSSGAKVFIEGDYLSQVDSHFFEGGNNGLHRVIDVFKGHEEFGYIQLKNVWRSKIAELCELL